MFTIEQGIILNYHTDEPRVCDVLQIPDNYIISNVRLPAMVGYQTKPLEKSVVLVASPDAYKSFIICVLREPEDYIELGEGIRGAKEETGNYLQQGEIQLEAAGDPSALISGTGGSLYLANDGTVNLSSGKRKEYLVLGGTDSDDDGEVLLVGDNGFFESNVNHLTQVRSFYRFDQQNNLSLGNENVLVTPVTEVATAISELTMSTLGKITLRNAALGVTNTMLEMAVDGKITLKNNFGTEIISNVGAYSFTNPVSSITLSNTGAYTFTNPASSLSISNAGAASLSGSSLSVSMSGSITQTGSTINLNSGTFGVARIQDTVTSNITTDPAWWAFWSTLSAQISALPTVPLDGGATLKAGLALLFATVPTAIISKITTGSSTVKAGG